MNPDNLLNLDQQHIWHPYSKFDSELPIYPVTSASGVRLRLADGRELIDGMASWWCAIHGYNHPVMNEAITAQVASMSHVMFGGLTHPPAVELTRLLVELSPAPLECIFFSDSGSVAVEVAMKLALQYWLARGRSQKRRFLTFAGGYHGDTFGAMSVCDPTTGMHRLFQGTVARQHFLPTPVSSFGKPASRVDTDEIRQRIQRYHAELAAVIVEPVVQGAGGMHFYSADVLAHVRKLCDEFDLLLILDEIATGFGRTGRMFACEHAGITPDIFCVGKALTGGYLSLAATLCTREISRGIDAGDPGIFMHGPTFMANPLACAAGIASLNLLTQADWQASVRAIESGLRKGLDACAELPGVADVRVLGAIGVVELKHPVDMKRVVPEFVADGVWVRPFGKLIYLMPPYVIQAGDLDRLTASVCRVVRQHCPR